MKEKKKKKINRTTKKIEELETLHGELHEKIQKHPWNQHDPITLIPKHLRKFSRLQISKWVENAVNAKYVYQKDKHYVVKNERMIVPVQYNETGVLQYGMVWSDGLAQFLQIKEGLPVEPEGVATNFISNLGFFKRFKAIYGLTGTIGEQATREFLEEIYNTDFVIIPPHKPIVIQDNENTPYLCKELVPLIRPKKTWASTIIENALYHARNRRAVLVICKYIDVARELAKRLKSFHDKKKIYLYTGDNDDLPGETIDSGEIVVATNIAGRGTDLKTTQSVEEHGGLYVAITFLPDTNRVEMQNVGRTARAGKKGMAQLIILSEEVTSIEKLKFNRHEKEVVSIKRARKEAQKMLIQDALFDNFCKLASRYLPSAYDFEIYELTKILKKDWHTYCSDHELEVKTAFKEWQKMKKKEWDFELGRHELSSNEKEFEKTKFEQKCISEEEDFSHGYRKNKLLRRFKIKHPSVSPTVWNIIKEDIPFNIDCSDLCRKFNWSIFERRALEERWGLWLKSKNIEIQTISSVLSLLESFETEFFQEIDKDSKIDNFIRNPYFFVLKGNEYVSTDQFGKGIICYDRAIALDDIFSVNAHYNKARASLSETKNQGNLQETALNSLRRAQTLIKTIYEPNLLAFHSLIAHVQPQEHTRNHNQQLLNIILHQENYIQKAISIIEEARDKKRHVKLSNELIENTFKSLRDDDFQKAIRLAHTNGLTYLFEIEMIKPYQWLSIIGIALISLAQLTAGFFLTCVGCGQWLIKDGVSNLIQTVKAAIKGQFDWGAWAIQKLIELSVASIGGLINNGFQGVKDNYNAAKDAVKNLIAPTTKVTLTETVVNEGTKEAVKQSVTVNAAKVVCDELSKGAMGELLNQTGQVIANKLGYERIESAIRKTVEKKLTRAFKNNELVIKGLEMDTKNRNEYWQQIFVQEGLKLVANDEPISKCKYIMEEIAKRVASNNITHFDKFLKFKGLTDMLVDLNNYTEWFASRFEQDLKNREQEILSDYTKTAEIPTDMNGNLTCLTSPLDIDIDAEEEDKTIDRIVSSSNSNRKRAVKPLSTQFNNLGSAAIENLVNHFRDVICGKLMNSVHSATQPILQSSINWINDKIWKEIDTKNAEWRQKIRENMVCNRIENETASQYPTLEENSGLTSPSEQSENADQSKNQPKNELTKDAKLFKQNFQKNGPNDKTSLSVLAAVIGVTIEIYDCKGNRERVIKNEKAKKGKVIRIVYEPGQDGGVGHYRPLDAKTVRNTNYQANLIEGDCWRDSVLMQLSESELNQLGGNEGINQKGAAYIDAHPKLFNRLCEQKARVQSLDEFSLMRGGLVEWAFEDYREARRAGNLEEAERLKSFYRDYYTGLSKFVVEMGLIMGVGAAALPVIGVLGAMVATTTASAILDDALYAAIKKDNWRSVADLLINHLPCGIGLAKEAIENFQKENFKMATFQGFRH